MTNVGMDKIRSKNDRIRVGFPILETPPSKKIKRFLRDFGRKSLESYFSSWIERIASAIEEIQSYYTGDWSGHGSTILAEREKELKKSVRGFRWYRKFLSNKGFNLQGFDNYVSKIGWNYSEINAWPI